MIEARHIPPSIFPLRLAAGLFLAVAGCNPAAEMIPDAPESEELESFDPDKLQLFYTLTLEQTLALLRNNREEIIIDIRTPEEFAISHIKGAYNYNAKSDEFSVALDEIEKGPKIVVYGDEDQVRTDAALAVMRGLGFRNVYYLIGGISAWRDAGHPVVRDIPGPGSAPDESPDGEPIPNGPPPPAEN